MSIRLLFGACVRKAGLCPEGCKSILFLMENKSQWVSFFFFFPQKSLVFCAVSLNCNRGSWKSSSRLERFPLSLLELCRVRAPQCQEQTHRHHHIMQTRCPCNLLRDTGNLSPGRRSRQGNPWKSFFGDWNHALLQSVQMAVSPFQADFPPVVRCWFNKGWKGLSSCELVCILPGCNEWRVLFSSAKLNASWKRSELEKGCKWPAFLVHG